MAPETTTTRKGHAARSAAMKRMMEAHQEEFDNYLREERESRGLFAVQKSKTEIMEENARLRQALADAGIELS